MDKADDRAIQTLAYLILVDAEIQRIVSQNLTPEEFGTYYRALHHVKQSMVTIASLLVDAPKETQNAGRIIQTALAHMNAETEKERPVPF